MPRRPVTVTREVEAAGPEAGGLDLDPVAEIIAGYHGSDDDLIPILQKTQGHYGYLPEVVLAEIARLTGIPPSRIYGVVTFYAQFTTVPRGRHTVRVCQGTACHVRGGHDVLRAVEKDIGISPGETSPDMQFSFETVACLGACSFAPVMTVDGQYFAKMKASRVSPILDDYDGAATDGGEA